MNEGKKILELSLLMALFSALAIAASAIVAALLGVVQ